MADRYTEYADGPQSPAREMFLITPGVGDISPLPKALRFNAAGTVTLQAVGSSSSVTLTVLAGEVIPVRALKVTASTVTVHGMA